MCGIHGFFDVSLREEQQRKVLQKMALSTVHRGPDDMGMKTFEKVAFAHNRLSIIDLSTEASQPMSKYHYTLVFNGEIYNYLELKEDLIKLGHSFKTLSDTEVILTAYFQWGKECVKKFMGMWAFALYDHESEVLFCSRDRFGIKPFYYICKGDRFYFASEIKALQVTCLYQNELNEQQIKLAVQMGWIGMENETLFEHIQQLEPATNLTFSSGKLDKNKYWNVHDFNYNTSDNDAVIQFQDLFQQSIKQHIRSDVEIASTLSGGLDSSAIAGTICKHRLLPKLNAFSVYYEGENGVDERPFVHELSKEYAQLNTTYLSPLSKNLPQDFHTISYHHDFPLLTSSAISQYYVMKKIKEAGIKVVLSGQGADDYLGGYHHAYYRYYADDIRKGNFSNFFHEFQKQKEFQNLKFANSINILAKTMISVGLNERKALELEYQYAKRFMFNGRNLNLNQLENSGNRFVQFHKALLTLTVLPSLLHYEDRNSMAHSIESRVPFLDHRLVEFSLGLSNSQKIKDGYTKWILRESMKDVLPDKIRWRRDKVGFVTPGETNWLRTDLSYLLDADWSSIPNVNHKKVIQAIKEFKNGSNKEAKLIWRLANMAYWIKNFV